VKFVDDFNEFLNVEVNLDQTRLDRLAQSVGAIENFLANHDTFKDIFLDIIPAGSWAHRTIIRPVQDNDEFDADMLLYVKECPDWQPKDYLENLWTAFRSSGLYKPKAERMTRCVRIDYECDFHIDVVPYLERGGSHCITNRRTPEEVGSFEASDPEKFTAWIDERQRLTNGHFIKVMRLVKYLRDFKNTFSCKSIILMTLLGNQVNAIEAGNYPELYKDVPTTLITLLEKLADDLPETMPAVMDPAETGENFSDRYTNSWEYENFRACIKSYAGRARSAYDAKDRETSIILWRDIFGKKFKPDAIVRKSLGEVFPASIPWPGEQFIDQFPYKFPIRIDPRFYVQLTGRVTGFSKGQFARRNGFRKFELAKQGNIVPKSRSLHFSVTTDIQEPFTVYWKVRNGGAEAKSIEQLRGEISKDEGYRQKTETTSYAGSHYVECYIVKQGVVVARDRQSVIVVPNR
jgi:Second Messenger Oligonucleotide or Dinucleotide Synthetase domain/Adenylyl/Guanylyl and SMODS C-terminal sensor domain